MKILHIHDDFIQHGGAEKYIQGLAECQKRKQHEVSIFSFSPGLDFENYYSFYREPSNRFSRLIESYIFSPSVYCSLKRQINAIKPDIIHIHHNYKYPFSVLLACRNNNVVQTVHDFGIVCFTSWYVDKKYFKVCGGINFDCVKNGCISLKAFLLKSVLYGIRCFLVNKSVNKLIAPSKCLKEKLELYGFKNVVNLPNFSVYEIQNKPNELPSDEQDYSILSIGRLQAEKGIYYLIQAMPNVLTNFPTAKLHLIGSGPEEKELKLQVKRLKIEENVIFHGFVSQNEVHEAYNAASLVVVPSIWMENSPLVVYESMAYGKPVIGSNIGGIPDLITDGESGFLVEPQNSDQIAERIIYLLSNDDLRRNFGNNAISLLHKNFTLESHVEKLERIYESLLAKR
ncbi:glycosyltransferase family 4 protein [Methanosarcina sp. KYL-1]|uniref:glycosyltransferase family 4 protein n=1 Tax=Methanosarcina sp. KYL-1 TaxID=2602068 RepID=UPI002100F6FF|nr:glycosyltransferase family 4 protein [Methanosarcina sp. KYL-1]MCQ1535097.1 glycosyltransferase family 4 protein [Methanosarcina sp. KYL-1]